jgi:hypothetical protein
MSRSITRKGAACPLPFVCNDSSQQMCQSFSVVVSAQEIYLQAELTELAQQRRAVDCNLSIISNHNVILRADCSELLYACARPTRVLAVAC